ncbi:MAG: urea transporter [Desulfovibrionaceae bacterium]|nr:urea transporter [Desulfovibrionaceae bacterium]
MSRIADIKNAWGKTVAAHPVPRFADLCLRGAGQVMFQSSAWAGLCFLAGIFWGAAHTPAVAWGAVLGLVTGTGTAVALRAPRRDIAAGLHGYNGMLVGCALPGFFRPTPVMWALLVMGAAFSTVMMLGLSRILKTWKVSAMTGPFVFTSWLIMLAAYNFAGFTISGLPHPMMPAQPGMASATGISLSGVWTASLTGISQVFLLNNEISGLLFLAGLAGSSLPAAVFAWLGSLTAIGTALFLGAGTQDILRGLFQFSAVLTAVGLGTVFYRPANGRVILYALFGAVFTVVAQGALNVLLSPFGIPSLTFPFVLAAWLFLLPNIDLLPPSHQTDSQPPPG